MNERGLMVCASKHDRFHLTYSDLSWNTRRSARMSLSAKGTCLPHYVAIGFADGIAITVI